MSTLLAVGFLWQKNNTFMSRKKTLGFLGPRATTLPVPGANRIRQVLPLPSRQESSQLLELGSS
jgi:hypothetical protein